MSEPKPESAVPQKTRVRTERSPGSIASEDGPASLTSAVGAGAAPKRFVGSGVSPRSIENAMPQITAFTMIALTSVCQTPSAGIRTKPASTVPTTAPSVLLP